MRDLIDRQAAIDAIKKCRNESDMPDMWYDGMSCALRCIYQLPSAQPERKKGEWIEREVTHIDDLEAKDIITAWQSCKCSVCGRYDTTPYMYYFDAPKYCGWCGAEMKGKDGEHHEG